MAKGKNPIRSKDGRDIGIGKCTAAQTAAKPTGEARGIVPGVKRGFAGIRLFHTAKATHWFHGEGFGRFGSPEQLQNAIATGEESR